MYLIAATGGLEDPTFKSLPNATAEVALDVFSSWSKELLCQPGDRVDLLKIDGEVISTIESLSYNDLNDGGDGL